MTPLRLADDPGVRAVESEACALARELRDCALGAASDLDPDELQALAEDTERLRRRIRDLARTIEHRVTERDADALLRARSHIISARRSVGQLMSRLTDD